MVERKYSAKIHVPRFRFKLTNESLALQRMTEWLRDAVEARTRAGRGARGALPEPKDGGRPLQRSGQLVRSIGTKFGRDGKGRVIGYVLCIGNRHDAEDRLAANRRHNKRRKAEAIDRAIAAGKTGKVRFRKARARIRNMDVASILAHPPRDLRSRNGHRSEYVVFEATPDENAKLTSIAVTALDVKLEEH